MVASLVMQRAVPAPDLGDVADQHQRADRHAGRQQRQRPLQHGRAAGLDLLAGRRLAAQRGQDPLGRLGALQRVVDQPLVTAARSSPTRWAARPSRRYADCAFGLA